MADPHRPDLRRAGPRYNFGWGTASRSSPARRPGGRARRHRRRPADPRPPRRQPRRGRPRAAPDAGPSSPRRAARSAAAGAATRRASRTGRPPVSRRPADADRGHRHALPARPPAQPPAGGRRHRLRVQLGGPAARRRLDLGRHRPVRRRARGPDRIAVGTVLHLGGVRFPITGPFHFTMTANDARRAHPPPEAPHHDPDPLRGLEALPRGPRRDRARAGVRAVGRQDRFRWIPVGEPVALEA